MPLLDRLKSTRRHAALVILGLALAASLRPAPLAAQVADASLEIIVLDQTQQVLPGVTVTVTRPDTGFTQTTVSDGAGLARMPALPPGTYNIRLELSGFAPLERRDVTLRVGQTVRLNATLSIASVGEQVTVTGTAPLVDVFKTDSSTNIVPEQIETLPVQDRDFQRLAFLAPGVQRERGGFRFIGGGPVIGAGGNASQSTILVDGVDFTDPALGLARARFSSDAISEFRVIANRFDTEIGGSAGGALSIVTKSGTNDVKGSAFGFFRDDSLRAQGALDAQKNNYSRQQYGGTVGGPIVKDKTHFFASIEQIGEDNITLFRPGGAYASQAADVTVPLSQTLLYGGVDHRFSNEESLRTKFVYERYRQNNFRVGGLGDPTSGMDLNRDNFNATATLHSTVSQTSVNQFSIQAGRRKFTEPNNSSALAEYFSSGNTLQTGANLVGDQADTGDIFEVRDTFFTRAGSGRWAADIKFGGSWQHVSDDWNFPIYPRNLMIYVTDTRALPLLYVSATGTGESTIASNLLAGFAQADLRPSPHVTLNLGVRYDLDTNGNNPGFTSPLQPAARGRDTNNIQPRAGLSWDPSGDGAHVVRGGVGRFTGRFLLVPAAAELQENGFTGRIIQQRVNGAVIGLPAFTLDAANPTTTGLPLARDAVRLDNSFVNPQSTQVTGGYTARLGKTGLFADVEGIYVKGTDEIIVRDTNWRGNATGGRPSAAFNQINAYTNEGRSEYKAFVMSLNGTLKGGHLITASVTIADKQNISDDFSPALTDYPNDPANIAAEYGRSRADERVRFVTSGVFKLPAHLTLAPIFEYGSGQPWNDRLGYDFNGDGKNGDRAAGLAKFTQDGPTFASMNVRLAYRVPLAGRAGIDVIGEAFNLFNRINYDVNSMINGEFLSGPTLASPALAKVVNPRFGQFTATLPPREIQLGVRFTF
jgi:Carboxypeptidase regulatory-like domain